MILIDTSVWIDHLRSGNSILVRLLNTGQVLAHPFVIGELALGNLRQRQLIRDTLERGRFILKHILRWRSSLRILLG